MLYEIKTTYLGDDSKPRREHYILDAELFAEAEATGFEQYAASDAADVVAVFRSDIREIVNKKEEDKPFFRAVVVEVTTDDAGKEKELKYPMLVCASSITEANHIMEQYLQQGYQMRLDALRRTKIKDYLQR